MVYKKFGIHASYEKSHIPSYSNLFFAVQLHYQNRHDLEIKICTRVLLLSILWQINVHSKRIF